MRNSNRLLLAATLSMLELLFIKNHLPAYEPFLRNIDLSYFSGIAMRITEDLTHR